MLQSPHAKLVGFPIGQMQSDVIEVKKSYSRSLFRPPFNSVVINGPQGTGREEGLIE
jgi:hypothetical protein